MTAKIPQKNKPTKSGYVYFGKYILFKFSRISAKSFRSELMAL